MQFKPIIYNEIKEHFLLDTSGKILRKLIRGSSVGKTHELINFENRKVHHTGYIYITYKGKQASLSRIAYSLYNKVDVLSDDCVDHIDGNRINNIKDNLRITNKRGNAQNRVSHRKGQLCGVCFQKISNKWQAQINFNNEAFYLGLYNTEDEAHHAYKEAEEMLKNNPTRQELQNRFKISLFKRKNKGAYLDKNGKYRMEIRINKVLITIKTDMYTDEKAQELFLFANKNRVMFNGDKENFKSFIIKNYKNKEVKYEHS